MGEVLHILFVFVTAAVLAVGLCRLVISLRVMDAPTEARKTQKTAVPSAGGLGVALAAFVAVVAVSFLTKWTLNGPLIAGSSGAIAYLAATGDLTTHMVIATMLGTFFAVLLGCGLFAAAFFSDKSGHDQSISDSTRSQRSDRG